MILYHGSDCIVNKPDILHSNKRLDFGQGFYLTSVKEQAERWAKRKSLIHQNTTSFINIFEFTEKEHFKIKDFMDDLNNWLDFVVDCRNGNSLYKQFDLIKGKVADDKVFRVVDMYKRGIWDKKRALEEIKVNKTYDQINIITQKAIDEMLVFKNSYEV